MELQQKFQWDGDGSELGSLKNECDEYVEAILRKEYPESVAMQKQVLQELIAKEGGNMCFDRGVLTGCKQYALQKTIVVNGNTHVIEIVKCKGYSQKDQKLTFDDMTDMDAGESLSQSQMQFRCPKSNYVSETRAFTIRTKHVTKRFRKIYSKGVVQESGVVLPHRI